METSVNWFMAHAVHGAWHISVTIRYEL